MGIDQHVAILIAVLRFLYTHLLMPAVHAADRVRVNGEGEVLMHATLFPPDALRIRVFTLERLHAFKLAHFPFAVPQLLQVNERRSPTVCAFGFFSTPTPQMM